MFVDYVNNHKGTIANSNNFCQVLAYVILWIIPELL